MTYVEITRGFGLYWVDLHEGDADKIGTVADYGPALTIWGARRRARRIMRHKVKPEFAERVG